MSLQLEVHHRGGGDLKVFEFSNGFFVYWDGFRVILLPVLMVILG